jgi:oligoribonuclease
MTKKRWLTTRWYPSQFAASPSKKESHRALDDIRESITELKYYQKHIFKSE